MVISELLRYARGELSDNAALEARRIVTRALDINETELITRGGEEAADEAVKAVKRMLDRRRNGEPLQYILGSAEFMSLEFEVNPSTLIPRADTETLAETVIAQIGEKKAKLLDIGAGTGCVGISIARYCGADVTLSDISRDALETAKRNALLNNVAADFLEIDILNEIPDGKFDVIVSNPPYIETEVIKTLQREVKDREPRLALDGGEDGLKFYRRIVSIAPPLLTPNGLLAFEIGYNQGKAVPELMKKDFKNIKIIKDLCGNDRVVTGRKK